MVRRLDSKAGVNSIYNQFQCSLQFELKNQIPSIIIQFKFSIQFHITKVNHKIIQLMCIRGGGIVCHVLCTSEVGLHKLFYWTAGLVKAKAY